jgi:hypothetical protein
MSLESHTVYKFCLEGLSYEPPNILAKAKKSIEAL